MLELTMNELYEIQNSLINNTDLKCNVDIDKLTDVVSNYIDTDYLQSEVYIIFPVLTTTSLFLCFMAYLYLQVL